jgi:hypothetical protein
VKSSVVQTFTYLLWREVDVIYLAVLNVPHALIVADAQAKALHIMAYLSVMLRLESMVG